jgi:DNA-binding beta-propeller fold protein YncE
VSASRCRTVVALVAALAVSPLAGLPVHARGELSGRVLGTLALGSFDTGAAGAIAWHGPSRRLFSANGETGDLDIIQVANPAAPVRLSSVDLGGRAASVAVHGDLVAVSVLGAGVDEPGRVVFLDPTGSELGSVAVGVGPGDIAFTPRGSKLVTADEGEPSDDYTVDPEGSVTIVDLADGPAAARSVVITFADFDAEGPRAAELHPAIRHHGPGASVAQDLEPESVTISEDGSTAWVSLQENNALAVIDVGGARVRELVPLRSSDLGYAGIDASSADAGINIEPWPFLGMFQPKGLAAYTAGSRTYLVTANEGALRDLPGFSEVARVGDLSLDPEAFSDADILQAQDNAGGLIVTDRSGDTDGDGDFDILFAAGSRSFSIWDSQGWSLVFDSADEFEQHIAASDPAAFNSTARSQPSFDEASTASGPQPAALTLGWIDGRTYAFIGLVQQGGVMVYDITKPTKASLVTYLQNRDWTGDPAAGTAGDLGPEALLFVPRGASSPTGSNLLLVSNAVSGTLTVWELTPG